MNIKFKLSTKQREELKLIHNKLEILSSMKNGKLKNDNKIDEMIDKVISDIWNKLGISDDYSKNTYITYDPIKIKISFRNN